MPFADNSLTMAVSRATLHHLPDKVKSLTEMYRVLQPGGVGLVHDMRRDVAPELLEKFTQMRASVGYPPTHVEEKGAAPQDYAFALKVNGEYHGQKLNGTGKIGGLLALQDAAKPFPLDRKSTRLNSSHVVESRMPSSA